MAQIDERKEELIAQLDRARSRIAVNRQELGEDLNAPARLKANLAGNFKRHRFAWLGGTALLGLILARIPPRKKRVLPERRSRGGKELEKAEKAGFAIAILKFVFDLAKPFLIKFGRSIVLQTIERRNGKRAADAWAHV